MSTSLRCLHLRLAATIKPQTIMSSKLRRQLPIAAVRVLRNKSFQDLKETPDDCDRTFSNTTKLHRFHVHLFKLFAPQLNDPTDSESIINTLLFHRLNKNYSPDTIHEQKINDAEKLKNEVIDVCTQTEFDNPYNTRVFPKHIFLAPQGYFKSSQNFSQTMLQLFFFFEL